MIRGLSQIIPLSTFKRGPTYSVLLATKKQLLATGPISSLLDLQSRKSTTVSLDKALVNAQQFLGPHAANLALQNLFSGEVSTIASYVKKLIGSNHPLLRTAKKIIDGDTSTAKTRGIIVLLIAKAAGTKAGNGLAYITNGGLLPSQQSLAEITEIIHTAYLIHRGILDTGNSLLQHALRQSMDYGNKVAVLCGDFLLAQACNRLASLRNTHVVELISSAIADLSESTFVTTNRRQFLSGGLPSWQESVSLSAGSLLSRACAGVVLLAGQRDSLQKSAIQFGEQVAFALQANYEITRWEKRRSLGEDSLVLVLQCQTQPQLIDQILEGKVKPSVDQVPLDKAIVACNAYVDGALAALEPFPPGDARLVLENLVKALRL